MSAIDLDAERDEDRALWNSVGELTALLPADWTLIGGLMVQLHAIERGITDTRVTMDIDPPPTLVGNVSAVGIPGGSQALARTETVLVRLDGREFELRRPTLLGAILIKARSLAKHRDPDAQREDLLLVSGVMGRPHVHTHTHSWSASVVGVEHVVRRCPAGVSGGSSTAASTRSGVPATATSFV